MHGGLPFRSLGAEHCSVATAVKKFFLVTFYTLFFLIIPPVTLLTRLYSVMHGVCGRIQPE